MVCKCMLLMVNYTIHISVLMAALVYRWPEKLGQRAGEECSRCGRGLKHPQCRGRLQHEEEERHATQGANVLSNLLLFYSFIVCLLLNALVCLCFLTCSQVARRLTSTCPPCFCSSSTTSRIKTER